MRRSKGIDALLQRAEEKGIITARDAAELGVPRSYIYRLVDDGKLVRSGRGVYVPSDFIGSLHREFAEVAIQASRSIICLLSALRFHDLTTESPWEIWLGVPIGDKPPRIAHPPIRTVQMGAKFLDEGVVTYPIDGIDVRMTTPARTVADCFKFRRLVTQAVAIEALADFIQSYRNQINELDEMARLCRVRTIIRPYKEALLR